MLGEVSPLFHNVFLYLVCNDKLLNILMNSFIFAQREEMRNPYLIEKGYSIHYT